MSEAKRFNSGKPKLGYFARSFHKALEAIARVKEFGATKYDDGNWRLGNKPDSEYLDSMARHLDAFQRGENYDSDSGCHHLGHAIWNLCAMLELNYASSPVIDKDLFQNQMKYWASKKESLESGTIGETVLTPDNLSHFAKSLEKLNKEKPKTHWIQTAGDKDAQPTLPKPGAHPTLPEPGAHPYIDGNGNPLSLKQALEMKAAGLDIWNRVPDFPYISKDGTPLTSEEAEKMRNSGQEVFPTKPPSIKPCARRNAGECDEECS